MSLGLVNDIGKAHVLFKYDCQAKTAEVIALPGAKFNPDFDIPLMQTLFDSMQFGPLAESGKYVLSGYQTSVDRYVQCKWDDWRASIYQKSMQQEVKPLPADNLPWIMNNKAEFAKQVTDAVIGIPVAYAAPTAVKESFPMNPLVAIEQSGGDYYKALDLMADAAGQPRRHRQKSTRRGRSQITIKDDSDDELIVRKPKAKKPRNGIEDLARVMYEPGWTSPFNFPTYRSPINGSFPRGPDPNSDPGAFDCKSKHFHC